jgi:hypothetical protein
MLKGFGWSRNEIFICNKILIFVNYLNVAIS